MLQHTMIKKKKCIKKKKKLIHGSDKLIVYKRNHIDGIKAKIGESIQKMVTY